MYILFGAHDVSRGHSSSVLSNIKMYYSMDIIGCRFRREIRRIDIILTRVILCNSYNFIGHIVFLPCCILRNRPTPQRCILRYRRTFTHRRARK